MRIIYDDYNSHIVNDKVIGTLTPQFGNSAFRNGIKMIEIYHVSVSMFG